MFCRGTTPAPSELSGPPEGARRAQRETLPLRRSLSLTNISTAVLFTLFSLLACTTAAWAQSPESSAGGEANLIVPALNNAQTATFFGMSGASLLMVGLLVCVLGMVFGLMVSIQLKNAPVHRSMLEISELIYETCKTYLIQQMKFLGILWVFIGTIIVIYFGWFQRYFAEGRTFQVL